MRPSPVVSIPAAVVGEGGQLVCLIFIFLSHLCVDFYEYDLGCYVEMDFQL